MKKLLLPLISFTLLLTACNTKKNNLDPENRIVFTDTASLNKANASSDVGTKDTTPIVVANKIAEPKVQVKTITKVVKVYEKQRAPKVVQTPTPPVVVTAPTTTETTTNTGNGNTTVTTGDGTTPAETKKKNTGWSQAAKTATIGGVGGAVIGGVIGKGAKGAAIGGVIGAAGGYILGRKADRKSGRVDTSRN